MSFIQNFYTSRDNNTDGNTYVGQEGRLWYNPLTNSIYVNTANVVGGTPVALATGANAAFNNITVNTIGTDDSSALQFITDAQFDQGATIDVGLTVTGDISVTGNISPAATGKIGGITPGPGVVISNEGELTIDTANLPLSFGNFTASNNVLSIVNVDEDMILQTEGTAEIQLIGNVGFYKPDGLPPNVANRFAFFNNDGQITILVPVEDPIAGGVEIIGSATGTFVDPGAVGTMLHLTGNPDTSCRLYQDSLRNYSSFVARRYNGTTASPGQVLAGEDVFRINTTAATDAGMGNVSMAQIRFTALENQTTTAQGSEISFYVTPIGDSAANRVEVANITAANGITASKFTTTGNIDGGNVNLTGNVTADYVLANNVGSTGNLEIESGETYWYFNTDNTFTGNGNVNVGNVNSYVTLPAGTSSKAPLVFTTSTMQTVPTVGAMNYDGRVFYATPQTSERGLIVTEQVFIPNADYALVNQTAMQSMLGVATTLSSSTRYAYRILAVLYKTSNNITMSYASSGTVTLANHSYQTLTTAAASLATITTPNVVRNILTTGFDTGVTVTAALNGTGYYSLTVNGILNVTTGGTWYPMVGFSGLPGTGSYTAAGTSIEIWPIGPTGANVSIGNWT